MFHRSVIVCLLCLSLTRPSFSETQSEKNLSQQNCRSSLLLSGGIKFKKFFWGSPRAKMATVLGTAVLIGSAVLVFPFPTQGGYRIFLLEAYAHLQSSSSNQPRDSILEALNTNSEIQTRLAAGEISEREALLEMARAPESPFASIEEIHVSKAMFEAILPEWKSSEN